MAGFLVFTADSVALPIAIFCGGMIFIICCVGGQYTWVRMSRLYRHGLFDRTSLIGEPTLLGLTGGLVAGSTVSVGIFFGMEPEFLHSIDTVIAISVVFSLLVWACCSMCCVFVLKNDLGFNDGTRCQTMFVFFTSCLCGVVCALGVGLGLGFGLQQHVNSSSTASTFKLSTKSLTFGGVIAVLLVLFLVFAVINVQRLRRDYSARCARNAAMRAVMAMEANEEQQHMDWFREAQRMFAMGLSPSAGAQSALYTGLCKDPLFDRNVIPLIFQFLEYDSENPDNNMYLHKYELEIEVKP